MKRGISICSGGALNPIHKEGMCYRKDECLEVMETLLGALLQSSKQPACRAGRAGVPGPHTRSFVLFSFALSLLAHPPLFFLISHSFFIQFTGWLEPWATVLPLTHLFGTSIPSPWKMDFLQIQ